MWLASVFAALIVSMPGPASAQLFYWPSGSPPVYATQAVRSVIASSGVLSLPAGLTWTSLPFAGPPGGMALISFQPPSGDNFVCSNPVPTATASGNFSSASVQSCSSSAIQVLVSFGSAVVPTAGTITLGAIGIAGTSPGLAALTFIPSSNLQQLNCGLQSAACDISATIVSSNNAGIGNGAFGGTLVTIMAISGTELTYLATTKPANGEVGPICIDMFSYESNGMAFQQPCQTQEQNPVSVADLGTIDIAETHYLGANGTSAFQWSAGPNATGTVVLTGTCGGLMLENIGSVPASCGILPLAGTQDFLIPATSPATAACPQTVVQASTVPGAVKASVNPPGATFAAVPYPNATVSPPPYDTKHIYYEVCVYGSGAAVIGASSAWTVGTSIDCGSPPQSTCTGLAESAGTDALLVFDYNGLVRTFLLTNGAYNQLSYLRIVNDTAAVPGPAPAGEVVCKVQMDDGYNGYATLFTNPSGFVSSTLPGLSPGTNILYPVSLIFQNAGILPPGWDVNNYYDFGSLMCFYPAGITIEQIQADSNGTIVNIE
jgi:hypothetical protein